MFCVPAPRGICSLNVQSFDVLFDGKVFPCFVPADHCLGDVRLQDQLDIWNGPAFVELRRAHDTRRGTVFCSGRGQAPHLPQRRPAWLQERIRDARRAMERARTRLAGSRGAHPVSVAADEGEGT